MEKSHSGESTAFCAKQALVDSHMRAGGVSGETGAITNAGALLLQHVCAHGALIRVFSPDGIGGNCFTKLRE